MKKVFIYTFVASFIFEGCQDKIDVKLDAGTPQLVVDAFINNKQEKQTIHLAKSSGYFDNSASPTALSASVKIKNNRTGKNFFFLDISASGDYIWIPGVFDTIASNGDELTLSITYDGQSYTANSTMNPAPPIDSVSYIYKPKNSSGGGDSAGYFASFYGRDFAGETNYYWIKSYRNGILNNNPANINIAWDAAFGPGADGFTFILPIRDAITPSNNPFQWNDTVKVEIHALTEDTWNFLSEVRTQTTNGGLFATPPANVRTNIKNTNANSEVKAVGFFNAGAVSTFKKAIQ